MDKRVNHPERREIMNRYFKYRQKLSKQFLFIIIAFATLIPMNHFKNAHAAGLLIADGGFGGVLEITEHEVHVTINNGVAVTRVTQVFKNTEKRQVEALYTFPVPKGASVANFSMWINGKEMIGEVLEKKRAREIYNSYKQKRRDPGLLEQINYKTFEMRIFPINADAEQKVQISYYQELDFDHDQATYVYPLATVTRRDMDSRTTGKFAINMDLKSAIPITTIESPSHTDAFVVIKHSDTYGQASLETNGGSLASDVVMHYRLARPRTGLDLLTSNQDGEDGYFMLALTAGQELAAVDEGMDYVFLLDISGSMGTDSKLVVSRNSLEAFIDELGDKDRFELMTFNVNPNMLFNSLTPVDTDMKTKARTFMKSQQARGGTVLAPAMITAYKYGNPDRTLNVVILSDGMTEQKERRKLMELIRTRPRNSRVFCIGVGNEVNRPLLEQMAQDSGGLAAFISRGDDFKRQAKSFRRKLMRPVASDLQIDIKGVRTYDLEPKVIPNLYHGSPIRIYGRYAGAGEAKIDVKGQIQGLDFEKSITLPFPDNDPDNPEIERMWAWKRVDQLLKTADRNGSRQPVVDEVIDLGETYSIVTEYTSFLVLENDAEYKRWKIERRNNQRMTRDRKALTARNAELEMIRNKAVADIGPQPLLAKRSQPQAPPATVQNQSSSPAPAAQPQQEAKPSERSQSRDFGFGSGPVGPLFVWFAWWLNRRKRKK
jgi:Ca-activated chloride channel family protein